MMGVEIFPPTIFLILAFVFGCVIGSFLNVLIWRLPQEKKITGRSHCAHCNHVLSARDLVPVFSIALARGRCRYCKAPISWRYPIIEIITGLLFAFVAYHFFGLGSGQFNLSTWLYAGQAALAVAVCLVIFVIDLEHYLILDRVIYPSYLIFGVLAAVIAVITAQPVLMFVYFFAAIISALPFWAIWYFSKGRWMGFGDVKFVALMGLILGWPGILAALLIAFIGGAIIGVILIFLGKKQMGSKIPFGTFLAVATVIALFYGPVLWNWYWHFVV